MAKLYEIDFAALSGTEKSKFILDLKKLAEECFSAYPFEATINAQLLIFTRYWNSYRLMAPEIPTPKILDTIMEMLWDYQEGTIEPSEFMQFADCLDAVVIEIATGDTEKLDKDEAYYDFKARYFWNWAEGESCYDCFLIDVSYLFQEISEHIIDWNGVQEIVDCDIADLKIPFLEEMDEALDCTANVLEEWFQEVYDTPRFCEVISFMQKDIQTAMTGKPMAELRKQYQNEYLFSPEDCAKI
nr:hypothetical protein [Lachnospiraceae bacterium]